MAARRGTGLVNQRTLAVDPDPAPTEATAPRPAQPPAPPPPADEPARSYAPVVSSSDDLWERRARWQRTRERVEAAWVRTTPEAAKE